MSRPSSVVVRSTGAAIALFLTSALALGAPPDDATNALLDSFGWNSAYTLPFVDLDAMKRALDAGADPNYLRDSSSVPESLVRFSTMTSDPEITRRVLLALRMLFDHGAHLQSEDGTILLYPMSRGQTDIVRLLLDHGTSPTGWPAGTGLVLSPIECATEYGCDDIVALLVARGAKPVPEADAVQLRFVHAAAQATTAEVDSLLSRGAQVNAKNRDGGTALLSAISGFFGGYDGYLRVKYLLDKGADPNLKGRGFPFFSSKEVSPLHSAVWTTRPPFSSPRSEDRISSDLLVRALLEAGAFVSGIDEDGRTPLHIAAETNAVPCARILLESGAKVMPRDRSGKTPLDYAESAEMIRLLKEYGATEQ